MLHPFRLHNFEGPLHLLLQLIDEKQLDITNVALADVTEQFLAHLDRVEDRNPEELADFLVMATRLLLLKSHALLPYLEVEEEEHPDALATQLKMYKQYADAAASIDTILRQKNFSYARLPRARSMHPTFAPPPRLTAEDLRTLFHDVLCGLEPIVRIPKAAMQHVVTVREKLIQLEEMLAQGVRAHFHELLQHANDRAEVVVTFLALLELVKRQAIGVRQRQPFAPIEIKKLHS